MVKPTDAVANDNDMEAVVAGIGHAFSAFTVALTASGAVDAAVLNMAADAGAKIEGVEGLFCRMIQTIIRSQGGAE